MEASCRGFDEEDIHSNIPAIACPTLMLFADEYIVISEQEIAELSQCLTNPLIRLHEMTNVGHMVPWDDLDQFIALVTEFIPEADQQRNI